MTGSRLVVGPVAALIALSVMLLVSCGPDSPPVTTIDFSQRRQTIQGLGVTATGTWIPEVAALYGQASFAAKIREDLGASIIRLALPPEIQPVEDLDAASLNLASFDFTRFNPPANFIRSIHAADPGVKIILSIWSPPAWMKTHASTKNGGRLRPDRRGHFAKFCAAACLGFERAYGVPIHALSIQNEPHFSESYDSCVYTPEELRDTAIAVAAAFERWKVPALLMAPEDVASEPRWMKYASALGSSTQPHSILNVHNEPETDRARAWKRFHLVAKQANRPLWMTETSGEDPAWLGREGKPGALELARKIHDALTFGQCEAWVYWAIADPAPSEFALMSLAEPTPKFHAARQFFRFIRPGAVRLQVSPGPVLISAFHHERDRTLTLILVNTHDAAHEVKLSFKLVPGSISRFEATRSSEQESSVRLDTVSASDNLATVTLPGRSVTTLRGEISPPR